MLTSRSGRSPLTATGSRPEAELPARAPTGAVEKRPTLGIVAALATEARALGRATHRAEGLARLRDGTLIAVSGIGCAAAARGAERLVAAGSAALVSFGLGGALDPALPPGAILVADQVLLEGSDRALRPPVPWRERVHERLRALGWRPLEGGALLTSPRMLAAVADKAAAFRATGAAVVDMESFAVAEVAAAHGLPFIAVRVVVDRAEDELPHILEGLTGPSGEVSVGRLIVRLLRAPSGVRQVARLARRHRAATRVLRGIARAGALRAPSSG